MTLWCVKGGSAGEREKRMLDNSVLGIGWEDIGDLTEGKKKDHISLGSEGNESCDFLHSCDQENRDETDHTEQENLEVIL